MAQIERQQAFKKEIFLWIVVAVSILLFISNFGIGGHLGNAVSGFLFGVFGMVAYIFPLVLLVGSFFAVSNKGNSYAIIEACHDHSSHMVYMCVYVPGSVW